MALCRSNAAAWNNPMTTIQFNSPAISANQCQSCSRAVVQSCGRAVVQSCSRAVVQSCSRAVVQSCNRAVVQSCGRAIVQSCSRAVVQSCGRAVVRSCGRPVVQSCSRAIVRSCGRAVVRSCGRAVVRSCGRAVVRSCNRAIVRMAHATNLCLTTPAPPINILIERPIGEMRARLLATRRRRSAIHLAVLSGLRHVGVIGMSAQSACRNWHCNRRNTGATCSRYNARERRIIAKPPPRAGRAYRGRIEFPVFWADWSSFFDAGEMV